MPPKTNPKKRQREIKKEEGRRLTKEQEQTVRAAFRLAVTEEEALIDKENARAALQSLGFFVTREEVNSFLSSAEDSLDLYLFSQIASIKFEQQRTSETAFDLFDRDGKGVICFEDLQRITAELGEEFTDEVLQEMIDEVDHTGEGLVSKDDFYRIICKMNL